MFKIIRKYLPYICFAFINAFKIWLVSSDFMHFVAMYRSKWNVSSYMINSEMHKFIELISSSKFKWKIWHAVPFVVVLTYLISQSVWHEWFIECVSLSLSLTFTTQTNNGNCKWWNGLKVYSSASNQIKVNNRHNVNMRANGMDCVQLSQPKSIYIVVVCNKSSSGLCQV